MNKAILAPISGIVALCVVLFVQLAQPGFVETFSLSVFDSFQRIKPREMKDTPVRIIDVDEASLKARGQWPWPRTDIAKMVKNLGEMGAAAISFDIVFSEPDRTSPARILEQLRRSGTLEGTLSTSGPLDNDDVFADTIDDWPVIAGMVLLREPNETKALVKTGIAVAGSDPRDALVTYGGIVGNLPALESAAKGVGYFSFEPDRFDRTVRRLPVVARRGEDIHPSLLAESLRVAQQAGTIILKSSDASGEQDWGESVSMVAAKVGQLEIPTNEAGEIWIYHAGHQPERFISAHKLVNATAADLEKMRPFIEGHIVLIGASAAGLLDVVATPISSSTAGVEVQAEALEMVLSGQYLHRPDWARGLELAATVLFSCLLIFLMPAIGPLWCAVLGAFVVAICVGGSWFAFSHYNYLFDTVYPLAGATFVYLVVSGVLFLTAENQRIAIRQAFAQYLAPELVERLADDPSALKLGGEERELTVLFSDVRGFTSLSEKLTSEELAELMNAYFTPMTSVLLRSEATIDKYIGDAIMAFWNAPLDVENHAARACEAALDMIDTLETLRQERGIDLNIGIGLNTGVCSVGNFGSDQRFNYSALGDAVNLSARIEGLTKYYGADILIGSSTAAKALDFALLELDLIRVVGKTRPERIFAVLGEEEFANTHEFLVFKASHEEALAAYRSRKWTRALGAFAKAKFQAEELGLYLLNYEKVAALYEERILKFRKRPPPLAWDGVSDAESK